LEIHLFYSYRFQVNQAFENSPKRTLLNITTQIEKSREALQRVAFKNKLIIFQISLAKQEEEIFTTLSNESIKLPADNNVRKLLQRVRDEAHRFAITFHREVRDKNFFK